MLFPYPSFAKIYINRAAVREMNLGLIATRWWVASQLWLRCIIKFRMIKANWVQILAESGNGGKNRTFSHEKGHGRE